MDSLQLIPFHVTLSTIDDLDGPMISSVDARLGGPVFNSLQDQFGKRAFQNWSQPGYSGHDQQVSSQFRGTPDTLYLEESKGNLGKESLRSGYWYGLSDTISIILNIYFRPSPLPRSKRKKKCKKPHIFPHSPAVIVIISSIHRVVYFSGTPVQVLSSQFPHPESARQSQSNIRRGSIFSVNRLGDAQSEWG